MSNFQALIHFPLHYRSINHVFIYCLFKNRAKMQPNIVDRSHYWYATIVGRMTGAQMNAEKCSELFMLQRKSKNCFVNTSKICVCHTPLTSNKILLSRCINYSINPFMLGCTQRLSCFSSRANSKHWNHVGDLLDRFMNLRAHTHSGTGFF